MIENLLFPFSTITTTIITTTTTNAISHDVFSTNNTNNTNNTANAATNITTTRAADTNTSATKTIYYCCYSQYH